MPGLFLLFCRHPNRHKHSQTDLLSKMWLREEIADVFFYMLATVAATGCQCHCTVMVEDSIEALSP